MHLSRKFGMAAIGLALTLTGCGKGYNSGNGNQVGTIVRLGVHGAWCPSNEGELALQNFRGTGGNSTLDFTVFDPDILKQLQKSMEDRSVVEVTWEKRSMSGLCTMESDHIITKVKEFNAESSGVNPKMTVVEQEGQNQSGQRNSAPGQTLNLGCVPGANNTLSCAVK